MIGLVFVSHSAKLAEGVKELAEQMAGGSVRIAAVGGGPDGSLGTDAERIAEAIQEVQSGEGVLVLMDLGSAVMSAQVAVEMLHEGGGAVVLSNAPIVEGGVVAAVEASIGTSLDGIEVAAVSAATMRKVEA
ncbi:MAG: dihydroxyacetone kinase phosphoryl donor subunit DhaM [Chloroflexota bacterium]